MLPNKTHYTSNTFKSIFVFEDKIELTCDSGYQIQGDAVISCLANQAWSRSPTCILGMIKYTNKELLSTIHCNSV